MLDTLTILKKTLIQPPSYSLEVIRDEVRRLIKNGIVSRQQPISVLYHYIPLREWDYVERELENNSFLLRDRLGDLIGDEKWEND